MESFRLLVGIQLILSVLILNESRTCIAQGLKTATTTVKCSRKHSAVLTEFGGVGDGVASNTKAFKAAIDHLRPLASDGGAQLIVPPGKWLTGSFNLTSNFTLFLHKDAVILASQEESEYPILEPLPSYGLEKNSTGRFSSLIMGTNLTDVVITDSCSNTRIEDCFIVSGDDCIAIKSGFDQYGIKMGMPSEHIIIRRLTCISPDSATIALGSEMSGGIKDIRAEDVTAIDTQAALRIKTAPGRGGYIKDIFTRRFILKTMQFVFRVNEFYKTHAEGYDPTLLSDVSNINCRDMVAENVTVAAEYEVLPGNTFTGICISNTTMTLFPDLKTSFKVETWDLLPHNSNNIIDCSYPQDKLPIEDVPLKTCSL
ncbi:hypothetical protein CsatA_028899 [Cannabis sativa]